MRTVAVSLLVVGMIATAPALAPGQDKKDQAKVIEVGKPEPSEIPQKLMADAKKAFAQKKLYYIWTDAKAMKAKDCKVRFALNPDFKEEPAFTVAKYTYTARNGMRVPFSSTGEGILQGFSGPEKYKGTTDVTLFLIKSSDVINKQGVNPNPEKLPPISNTIAVKMTFE